MSLRAAVVLAGIAAVACVASPMARRVAWFALRSLGQGLIAVVVLVVEWRRAQRTAKVLPPGPARPVRAAAYGPRPAPEPIRPLTSWHVIAEIIDDRGGRWRLTSGVVTGPWTIAAEVQAAGLAQWNATREPLPRGRLSLRVAPSTTAEQTKSSAGL